MIFQANGDLPVNFQLTHSSGESVEPSCESVKKQNYFRLIFNLKPEFRGVTQSLKLEIKVTLKYLHILKGIYIHRQSSIF